MPQSPEDRSARKTRSRSGCLTCRRRHVKCDEGKPQCKRCQKANVRCEGYEGKRSVPSREARKELNAHHADTILEDAPPPPPDRTVTPYHVKHSPRSPTPTFNGSFIDLHLPITKCDDFSGRRFHQRAHTILGHSQYASRTASILFNHDHHWFWRDYMLSAAWSNEIVFDAIVAVGNIHGASLMKDRRDYNLPVADVVFSASESYQAVIHALTAYGASTAITPGLSIAVKLLMAYYKCFDHDPATTFHHLQEAKRHFVLSEYSIREQTPEIIECLRRSIRHLDLTAKILLPQLVDAFQPAVPVVKQPSTKFTGFPSAADEKEALVDLISYDDFVYVAIWKPFSGWALELERERLKHFREDLLHWRSQAIRTFGDYDQALINTLYAEPKSTTLDALAIPPPPQRFRSGDAAIAAVLYHCYMARVSSMLSVGTGPDAIDEIVVYAHAYEVFRIAEAMWSSDGLSRSENSYLPCEAINVSLASLLFITSQACYNTSWQTWVTAKLRALGVEGLHDGRAYATCLEISETAALRYERIASTSSLPRSCSPLGHVANRVVCVLVLNTGATHYLAYFIRGGLPRPDRKTIIGRATWKRGGDAVGQDMNVEFLDSNSPTNIELGNGCVYRFLANREPIAVEWRWMLTA